MSRLFCLLICAITFFSTGYTGFAKPQLLPGECFRQDLTELLNSLSDARLLSDFPADQEADFLVNFLHRLSIPALITNLNTATDPAAIERTNPLQVLSQQEGILYLRLDNFHQSDTKEPAVLPEEFINLQGQALIIDLRHSWGFSLAAEDGNFRFLTALKVPMLILIDSATAGTPESLVQKLQTERQVLVLGRPSTGIGGTGREIKLSSGLILRVPRITNNLLPKPLLPDVELLENPALFSSPENQLDPGSDPWCQHARDTLKVILTLEKTKTSSQPQKFE
ncbi:MAG: hypothetical protein WCT05_05015 [Lentisphaeria bacterium]